jgi:hypothetical protein
MWILDPMTILYTNITISLHLQERAFKFIQWWPDDMENKHLIAYFMEVNLMLGFERQGHVSGSKHYFWLWYDSVLDSQE